MNGIAQHAPAVEWRLETEFFGNLDAAVFGLIVADIIAAPFALRTPPAPGGLSLVDSITLTTGGNVCNTGIAMAKLVDPEVPDELHGETLDLLLDGLAFRAGLAAPGDAKL